ncbi:MAG: hypothetical protein JRH01_22390 [Deltaproteobacteria bacterium]|nr:hypothetical protein [Deltaproteobacteria bacterium]MBW2396452.1 hypothetical protein [Deltaproteobacteria bacterium]
MKWPASLVALVDYGIIDEVLRPLMSGKEAQVYLVRCGAEERVAKVYKEAEGRSFRQRADYTEGRRTRNSRDQRAVDKRTRHGRAQDEEAWRVTEVDRIRRLRTAGVRVPEPHEFVDGVLVMELVKDADGHPAPRLGDLSFSAAEAGTIYDTLIRETVRMLAADIVHGDLSEFNVLMGADGPVLIDFPQAVDPASNRNARTLLLRDVKNLHRFLSKFAPGRKIRHLGEEMWKLYEEGKLKPDSVMRGTYRAASGRAETGAVLALIEDAKQDALRERSSDRDDDAEFEDERSKYADSGSNHAKKQRDTSGEGGSARRRVVDFTKDSSDAGGRTRGSRSGARKTNRSEGRAGRSDKKEADRAEAPKRGRARGGRKRTRNRSGTNESRSDETRSRGSSPSTSRSQGQPNAKPRTASNEPTRGRRRTRRTRKPASEGRGASAEKARTPSTPRTQSSRTNTRHQDRDENRKPSSEGESTAPRKRSRRRRRRRPTSGGSKPTSS